MVKRISRFYVIPLFFILLVSPACLHYAITDSKNPPETFQESDLVGTWRASYSTSDGVDTLILRADGTFKQTYASRSEDYVFETPWNEWWVEYFPDGRVRVRLEGARYYYAGIEIAEEEGIGPPIPPDQPDSKTSDKAPPPFPFYDPFARYTDDWTVYLVEMVGELVLNVRLLPSEELALANMWYSSDIGFGDSQLFRRVETSSSP
jgi:hypothetical protein